VEHFTRTLAGAEVNVAIGLTRLGHQVSYITRLGDDILGRYIRTKLRTENIGAQIVFDPDHFTGFQLKEKMLTGDPLVCYFRKNSAASMLCEEDVNAADLSGARLLHLTGIPPALSAGARAAAYRMIERAKAAQIQVSFDPNLRPGLWENQETMIRVVNDIAAKCDMVLPNLKEGRTLTGFDDEVKIADYYLNLGVKMVTVKLGKRGSFTKTGKQYFYQPNMPIDKIVDTVGAGDGFAVGIISGTLEGLSLEETVQRGNAIGALQLRQAGDNEGLPTSEELRNYLEEVKNGAFANGY
ncbi:MAG: sugar kinase, partial [Treponema sp.]|nr:sugar kinase [Treponema sp.]